MTRLQLTYAGCDYWDRTRALMDGSVQPAGIDLNYIAGYPREIFRRMAQHAEFHAAELSMSTYIAMVARGDRRLVAIPVFPSRNFRHSYLFVNRRAGIEGPEGLRGKRVGVPEYQMTAALWIRAFLQHDFGVHARDIHWYTGAMDEHGYEERYALRLPDDIRLEQIPYGKGLERMLDAGELDALIMAARPQVVAGGESDVVRLFPDYPRVEKAYYVRTGLFPIMHTVVIRRDVYEANPWVATSLYEAFELARRAGRERMRVTGPLAVALPWLPAHVEELTELFGGEDPWAYGVGANRKVLQTMLEYSHEQGLAERLLTVDELFAKETLVAPGIDRIA